LIAASCTAVEPLTSVPFPRLIAHLDMDAFYASVELLRYPELRGRPVVIGGGSRHRPVETVDAATGATVRTFATLRGYAGRGVVTTATYEARALGLGSAMGMMKASALAPEAVLLPVDFDAYRRFSRSFKAAVAAICPHVEDRGIDEVYVDLTALVRSRLESGGGGAAAAAPAGEPWQCARDIGSAMKRAVRHATGLTCSVSVAPNKLLAKIASELDKPDGLTVVTGSDLPTRIWPLAARKINGIGPKSAAKLESLGIHTIRDLAHADPAWLVRHFGRSHGAWMHEAANGRDDRPVVTCSEPKSISRETTFERDLHPKRDRDELSEVFTRLCVGVSDDLQRKGYCGRTVGLKLRYDDFRTVTRDLTLPEPVQDAPAIRRAAGECLKRVPLERRIRLLGVRIGSLHPANARWTERGTGAGLAPAPSLFD
jgi:DNA polymerase IV